MEMNIPNAIHFYFWAMLNCAAEQKQYDSTTDWNSMNSIGNCCYADKSQASSSEKWVIHITPSKRDRKKYMYDYTVPRS